MADVIDPRIVRVGIEIRGQVKIYEGSAIWASGTKYANPKQNEAEVKIANLDKPTRDFILSETSPFNKNRTPKKLFVEVGRRSYGTFRIFEGDITNATVSQPPDLILTLKALTGDTAKGNVLARSYGPQTSLRSIAQGIAADLGLALDFQARDKQIANFSFSGAALKMADRLSEAGSVNAFVDDGVLVVKNQSQPLAGRARVLNLDTGLIGQPELTEQGVKVRYLLDNTSTLGGSLILESRTNPSLSGTYEVYKLGFDIASRDVPFYYVAEAKRV